MLRIMHAIHFGYNHCQCFHWPRPDRGQGKEFKSRVSLHMDFWDRLMTAIEAWQFEEFVVMFYAIHRDLNRADRYAKEAANY